MDVEYTLAHEGAIHMSPIISLPEENNPWFNKWNTACCK
jgi:hypothetical protein